MSYQLIVGQFYEFGGGSVFQVAADANGVTYNPSTPIASPIPDGSTTTTSGSGNTNAAPIDFRIAKSQVYATFAAVLCVAFGASSIL